MVVRFKKKVRKLRGSKTHGWGSKKKHRGSGSQGGTGMSGLMKHKRSWMLQNDPEHFGRAGFKVPSAVKKEEKYINLKDLDAIASKMNKKDIDLSELGYDKVLSTGRLTRPLVVKAKKIVEKAKKKIEGIGGQAIEV